VVRETNPPQEMIDHKVTKANPKATGLTRTHEQRQ